MIGSDMIRGYTDVMILFLLMEAPSYGYEISRAIRQRSEGLYAMKETTLYSAFNRLQSKAYIEAFDGTETYGKKRTYYRLTPKGRAYYLEKQAEWALTKKVIDRFISPDTTLQTHVSRDVDSEA